MSEGESITTLQSGKKFSRRDFLKSVSVGALSMILPQLPHPELDNQDQVCVAALKVEWQREEKPQHRALRIVRNLKDLLDKQHVDLVVTPEYSFDLYDFRKENNAESRLFLEAKKNSFEVNTKYTGQQITTIVETVKYFAERSKTHILLSSFPETTTEYAERYGLGGLKDFRDNRPGKYYETMLHIDANGKIVGVKRKFHPPIGDFTMKRSNGQKLKILPLICGETWLKQEVDPTTGKKNIAVPPEWVENQVREQGQFDILALSMSQGDVDFNKLNQIVQETGEQNDPPKRAESSSASLLELPEQWFYNAFKEYFSKYTSFLKPDSPIIIADWNIATVLSSGLKPLENYAEGQNFASYKWIPK